MVVGIMQPYFLPYLGYWQLINVVDRFIIYENASLSYGNVNKIKKMFCAGCTKHYTKSLITIW